MLTKEIVYIGDFKNEADELQKTFGRTDLFSTGDPNLDAYMGGGGFGRPKGYEIVLLYGSTGIGKSLAALNWIRPAIVAGKKVGLLILEDDMADVSVRLSHILSYREYEAMNKSKNIICLPKQALIRSWSLDELLGYIEDWFTELNVDLILLDHLQYAFEGAESIKGENEWIAQRVFMQKLNQVMKRVKKTIILVSHINKGPNKGMDRVVGSGAIAQAATKVIEVSRDDTGSMKVRLHKSRFTKTPMDDYIVYFDGLKLVGQK